MDTAQRGMGLDWAGAQELIRRSLAEARTVPGADLACGAGTDHLAPADAQTLDDVIAAYEEQIGFVEKTRRPRHHDGEPGAGAGSPGRPTTTARSMAASSARRRTRSCCTGWATCSTRT